MQERATCLARPSHRKWATSNSFLEKDHKSLSGKSAWEICREADEVSGDKMGNYQTRREQILRCLQVCIIVEKVGYVK